MSDTTIKAEAIVESWLHGEHDYQFGKNRITHNADPQSSLAYIVGTEIGNKWHRFQLFNKAASPTSDTELYLQAGQQLLKACGAARGALVWSYALDARTVEQGSEQTWSDLGEYYSALDSEDEPLPAKELLEASLEEAIQPATIIPLEGVYTVKPIFTRLAGLAIVHLSDQQERFGDEMVLPKPGTASGTIEPWVHRF